MSNTFFDTDTKVSTTLSNGNLTATGTTSGSTVGASAPIIDTQSTGKYYFEATLGTLGGSNMSIGVHYVSSTYGDTQRGSICLVNNSTGTIYSNGSSTGSTLAKTQASGDVIGVAIDLDNRKCWFKNISQGGNWNGSGTANPATNTGGLTMDANYGFNPVAVLDGNGASMTLNFGDTSFAASAPSGFAGWPHTATGTKIEGINAAGANGGSTSRTISMTTYGGNRIVILEIGCCAGSSLANTGVSSISDTAGLTWHKHAQVQSSDNSGASNNLEVWWAAASSQLTNDTITITYLSSVHTNMVNAFAVANVASLSTPWDTNGSLPGTYDNTSGSSGTPTASISTTAAQTLVLCFGRTRSTAPWMTNTAVNVNQNGQEPSSGGDRTNVCWGFREETSTISSHAFTGAVTVNTQSLIVSALATTPQSVSGSMLPTEAADAFAATGNVAVAGTIAATDPADVAAIRVVNEINILFVTEARDTFAAAGSVPIVGPMVTSEKPDTWSTHAGRERLGLDLACDMSYLTNLTPKTISTSGQDRIIVLMVGTATVGNTPPTTYSVSDDAGLDWHLHSIAYAGPDTGSTFITLEIWWAYAHNRLINDRIFINSGAFFPIFGGFAVKGLNGNYNDPWDPISAGANFGGFGAPQEAVNSGGALLISGFFSAIFVLGDVHVPTVGVTVSYSALGAFLSDIADTIGFQHAFNSHTVGVQRNAIMNGSVQFSNMPYRTSPATQPDTGSTANTWIYQWDALSGVNNPPGTLELTEAPDTFAAIGYKGGAFTTGFMTPTEAVDTFQASGYVAVTVRFAIPEPPDRFSAYITQPLTGVLAATERTDVFTGAGIGLGEDGTFIVTEAPDIFSATGFQPPAGPLLATERPDRFSARSSGVTSIGRRRIFFVA